VGGQHEDVDGPQSSFDSQAVLSSLFRHRGSRRAQLIFSGTRTSVRFQQEAWRPGAVHAMGPDHNRANAAGAFVWLWILLTFIWFAANSSLAPESLLTGVLISAVLAYLLTRRSSAWRDVRFSPARLYHFVRYLGALALELVRANLAMMRYVLAPRIDIRPGIVEIRTRLKTPVGRLALANSIALTPGSLVIEIDDDRLFIHWLDVKTADPDDATRLIAGPFEEHLEKTFG
jgi:multicomponent Na+:H+ antiporter subunit E